jgi:hypothetical protein
MMGMGVFRSEEILNESTTTVVSLHVLNKAEEATNTI